jgi:ribonuclease T1
VLGAVALVLLAWVLGHGAFSGGGSSGAGTPAASGTVSTSSLPAEARQTLALIDSGGPFPYDQDGVVFGNREGLLPDHPTGYYHEYTVPTPGSPDRGARRIITGSAGEVYYTDDHYRSFERISR